ncbi:MAG: non-homologous end-joining DNA ligase [Acidimicrobiales bacterium]
MSPDKKVETDVEGRRIVLSNLDKVLYPKSGFTKGQVIDYYARIADVMLPHIVDRPLTLKRYPDGVDSKAFFEKHASSHTPSWVRRSLVPSSGGRHEPIEFVVICDRATLVWAANLAAIELHVPLWRVGDGRDLPKPPDHTVFDLDPGPGTSIVECCQVATLIAEHNGGTERIFAKTSGSKGLQLYVALSHVSSEEARQEAHDLARALESDHRSAVVSNMRKELRNQKVLIDWSQNSPSKTTVAAYSLRARPDPTVSTPVTWEEIESCASKGDETSLRFTPGEVLARVELLGDLLAPLAKGRPPPVSPKPHLR